MRFFWLACLAMACARVAAQALPSDSDLYDEARALAEKGDRAGAIERYNSLLERLPSHAGAWLDLALLYCEQGQAVRARQLFDEIESRFNPPGAIRDVIEHYRAAGCTASQTFYGQWAVSIGAGATDNANHGLENILVNLTFPTGISTFQLSDAYKPRSSRLGTLGASYVRIMPDWPDWQWFAEALQKDYPESSHFNQQAVLAGVAQQHVFGKWQQEGQVTAIHFTLGGKSYETGLVASGGLWLPQSEGYKPRLGVELEASSWRYVDNSVYDSDVWEPRINVKWPLSSTLSLRANLSYVEDNARGARPGLDRRGYGMNLGGQWLWSDRISLDANLRERRLRDAQAYSPLFGDVRHLGRLQQFNLGWQVKPEASSPLSWRVEWESIHSRDNIPLFPFTSNALTVNLQYRGNTR